MTFTRFTLLTLFCATALYCSASPTYTVPTDCSGTSSCTTTAGDSQAGQLFNDTSTTEVQMDFTAAMLFNAGCTTECTLDSISFRLPSGPPALTSGVDVGDVNVFLSAVAPAETNGNLSNTFAKNIGGAQTEVFSGALTIGPAGSGNPAPFDLTINFTTPYTYTFGSSSDILFEIVWTSSKTAIGENQDTTTDTTGLAAGSGSGFSLWGSATSPMGDGPSNNEFVAQFGSVQAPEPGSMWLLGAGLAGLVAFRRKRHA
jgi:PEP-CTERM motif